MRACGFFFLFFSIYRSNIHHAKCENRKPFRSTNQRATRWSNGIGPGVAKLRAADKSSPAPPKDGVNSLNMRVSRVISGFGVGPQTFEKIRNVVETAVEICIAIKTVPTRLCLHFRRAESVRCSMWPSNVKIWKPLARIDDAYRYTRATARQWFAVFSMFSWLQNSL